MSFFIRVYLLLKCSFLGMGLFRKNGFRAFRSQLVTSSGQIGNAICHQQPSAGGSTAPLGSYFGEYNTARDPRIIQLGVKLYF
jgi:hypothetical protein